MAQTDEKNKFYVSPTDRIDVLFALTKEQAKEQEKAKVKGKEYQKSLEQVDVLVMLALIGHRNNKTGQCDPSHALIASEIGVSVSTVQRSFKRLETAGFQTTLARSFKGLKTSSQVDIQFQKGEPWITKSDDARSRMTDRSVTDDATIGHGCHSRSVTDDANARSRMTDEHSASNSENEHSEPNTPSAPRREGPVDGLIVDGGDEAPPVSEGHQSGETEQAKPSNDSQPADWPEDWSNQFWDASPERKNVAATEKALIAIAKTGVKFQSILIAARRRCKTESVGYYRDPVKWLADKPWLDNAKAAKAAAERQKPKVGAMAI